MDWHQHYENKDLIRENESGKQLLADYKRGLDRGVRAEEDFETEELLLTLVAFDFLIYKFDKFNAPIEDAFGALFERKISRVKFDSLLTNFANDIEGAKFVNSSLRAYNDAFRDLAQRGALQVFPSMSIEVADISRLMKASAESMELYAKGSFRRVIMPRIRTRVDRIFTSLDNASLSDMTALRNSIYNHYQKSAYSRVLANAYANRTYNWASLANARARGVTKYRYNAVLDERTSAICRHYNGQEFNVIDALPSAEAALESTTEGGMETIDPYPNSKQTEEIIAGNDNAYIPYPPLHNRCRSVITPIA
ncbi:phage minor head protein [Prochlorococcus sp. ALOHA_ZT_50]|uniref:phage minor head protein n=1 Tax=Prochlorococcus sp. ALOHA_ZT_50 TaxID=2919303 RepID=UPI00257B1A11|nr:phage minor head protein [Prochlorococcus sp. ALOHA_ZT_50]MCH2079569.1 hypothetical protein [Prochlorococcus sp. ALOHA_ZT_50]